MKKIPLFQKFLSVFLLSIFLFNFIVIPKTIAVSTNGLANPWTLEKAEHLARRALLGVDTTIINNLFQAGSATAAVDSLFPDQNGPDRTEYNNLIHSLTSSTGFTFTGASSMYQLYNLKYAADPYQAKRKLFSVFEDIFSSNVYGGVIKYKDINDTHELIYSETLGNYKNLIKKILYNDGNPGDFTESQFLDLFNQSNKRYPNENYARELLQLFLMEEYKPLENKDLGNIRNYEETDVASFAKILFGFTYDVGSTNHIVSYQIPSYSGSDIRNVTFLTGALKSGDNFSFYNTDSGTIDLASIQAGGGASLRDNAINYIFSKREEAIALALANKLLRFYVTENPNSSELNSFANILIQNNFDIFPSIKWLLSNDMMYSDIAMNELRYKNPLELAFGSLKLLNQTHSGVLDPMIYNTSLLSNLGWEPYTQNSIFGRDGFDKNDNFFNANLQNKWITYVPKLTYSGNGRTTSAYDLLSSISTGTLTTDELISTFEQKLLLGRSLDSVTKSSLINFLTTNEQGSGVVFDSNTQKEKIESLATIMMTLPEFIINSGWDRPNQAINETSFLNETQSKIIFVDLGGGYDYLNNFFTKKNFTDMQNLRPTLNRKGDELVDLGEYYMENHIAYGSGGSNGLKSLYDNGELRIFNRAGTKDHSRDHDQASKAIQSCDSFTTTNVDGSFGKFIKNEIPSNTMVIGNSKPYALRNGKYINIGAGGNILNNEKLSLAKKTQMLNTLRNIGNTKIFPENTAGVFKDAITIDTIGAIAKSNTPRDGAGYGNSQNYDFIKTMLNNGYGKAFYMFADGGYDTHDKQLPNLDLNINKVITALVGFFDSVKANQDITIVLFSEFGRTIKENGGGGTDHGKGGIMWVLTSNPQLKKNLPQKIYGDVDVTKEKEDLLGVGIYYDSIYAKIVEALYAKTGIYTHTLEDDINTSIPVVTNFNTYLIPNGSNYSTNINFDIESPNFAITSASDVKIKYGKDLNNLTHTINNWEIQYASNALVKGNKINFTKQVNSSTGFAYEIKISNNQYAQNILTGIVNTTPYKTGNLIISDIQDTVLTSFHNKIISGEETISNKILLGQTLVSSTTTGTGDTLTGIIIETPKILTKGNGISLTIHSGSVNIEKLSGSGIWYGRFLLGDFVDKNIIFSSGSQTNLGEKMKNLNVEKTIKIGADTLGVGLGLDNFVEIGVDGLKVNTQYKMVSSEDLQNWKYMTGFTTDINGKGLFLTNHFSYFAFINDVIIPPVTPPVTPPPPVYSGGGGGDGGGGLIKDNCPTGDNSPSYYDKICGEKNIEIVKKEEPKAIITKNKLYYQNLKKQILLNRAKKKTNTKKLQKLEYHGYEIYYITGYNTKEITMKILNSTRLSQSYKTNYINRINAYIEAKYNYDVANIKRRELKNKLIKQTILLQRILKK